MAKPFDAFGPAMLSPPWRGARGARERLSGVDRERLARFEDALAGAWGTEDPIEAVGKALLEAWQGSHFALFPGAVEGPPRWVMADQFPRFRGTFEAIHAKMPVFRAYGERARDPFANRPAGCHDLALAFGRARMEGVVDELLAPIGYMHQLRSVLYDKKGAVALFAGIYRTKTQRPFEVAEHARLHAMQPALRGWTYLAEALGVAPIGEDDVAAQIERIELPCLVADGSRVLLANRRARAIPRLGTEAARWRALGSVVPLRTKRVPLDLVMLPAHLAAPPSEAPPSGGLPAYLHAVAGELARGTSDKEISAKLGVPLATVRTYVTRILARVGVRSRRELIRLG